MPSYHRFASSSELAELRGTSPSSPALATATVQLRYAPPRKAKAVTPTRNNSIFVVHGRDHKLTEDMYAFLRAIGINPMEWNDAIKAAKGGANPIVGDVIHDAMKKVQGVMVLLSADEDARLKSKFATMQDKKKNLHKLDGQPRPNVIFEAGLALGAHSSKTILVQVGDVREISDIAGKHMAHLNDTAASRKALALRLQDKLKFKVNLTGDTWLTVGRFER
ncbi:MAG: nucleotide-binding protein [Alphaproteobacteria bacterium]|nr:nucleotide-binding protein [Alphaproteobacteria bacterium]